MSAGASCEDRARLRSEIEEAARVIAPVWPLSTFIAVNPLWDLRDMSFDRAISHAAKVLGVRGYPSTSFFAGAFASGRLTVADVRAAMERLDASSEPSGDAAGELPGNAAGELPGNAAGELPGNDLDPCRRGDVVTPRAWPAAVAELNGSPFRTASAAAVDREIAKWCSAFVSGLLRSDPPGGFYAAWQSVVVSDPAARSIFGRAGRRHLADFGTDPETAILSCLSLVGATGQERVHELELQLARLPGWAGHAKWRSNWASVREPGPALHLVDYLAVRLCYEAVMVQSAAVHGASAWGPVRELRRGTRRSQANRLFFEPRGAPSPARDARIPGELSEALSGLSETQVARLLLAAFEGHYRDRLLGALDGPPSPPVERPSAQAVFCIDARSEGLRRHLEAVGPYETLGFAGFFALPARLQPLCSAESIELCPVLVPASVELVESQGGAPGASPARELQGRQALAAARSAFDAARKGSVAPFILAEATGFLAGPAAVAKTLAPRRWQALRSRARRILAPAAHTATEIGPSAGGMSDEWQASFAATALSMMGLTQDFAPIVLLCGHGSTTENNPFGSSLDCGACGGNRGGSSARAVAAIINRVPTRRLLADHGILIPDDTVFVAAEHDTATDEVTVLDVHLVPARQRSMVSVLQADLERAGKALADERAALLPGAEGRRRLSLPAERSADWAQLQPEWGLARNAAFIVAPRNVTAGVNLECRCFLHSYEPRVDPRGTALEAILTAPMIVAHWINAQYYFSTVDPDVLSAGDKAAHKIVAVKGVRQGAVGDLRVGLPIQSLFDRGRPYHEPMRLLVVVQAPLRLLEHVIGRNRMLQQLFDGQWVQLAMREDGFDPWRIWRPGGTWDRWLPAERVAGEVMRGGWERDPEMRSCGEG